MKVKELIAQLQGLDQERDVYVVDDQCMSYEVSAAYSGVHTRSDLYVGVLCELPEDTQIVRLSVS